MSSLNESQKTLLDNLIKGMVERLSPCPFCGGKASIESTWTPSYWVECTVCEAQVGDCLPAWTSEDYEVHEASVNAATNNWNNRTNKATTVNITVQSLFNHFPENNSVHNMTEALTNILRSISNQAQ